jgi:hypothetical protein
MDSRWSLRIPTATTHMRGGNEQPGGTSRHRRGDLLVSDETDCLLADSPKCCHSPRCLCCCGTRALSLSERPDPRDPLHNNVNSRQPFHPKDRVSSQEW